MATTPATQNVNVGLPRYDTRYNKTRHVYDKTLPDDIDIAHAVIPRNRIAASPTFLEGWQEQHAICGARVKILLRLTFDPTDPAACPRCTKHLMDGTTAKIRPRQEPLLDTARMTYSGPDGQEIYWANCKSCGYVGSDRNLDEQAEDDADRHNLEKHKGALKDVEHFY